MKVFGVGWAKTGTTTLGRCFEILGFRHMGPRLALVDHLADGNLAPIPELAQEFDTFED